MSTLVSKLKVTGSRIDCRVSIDYSSVGTTTSFAVYQQNDNSSTLNINSQHNNCSFYAEGINQST